METLVFGLLGLSLCIFAILFYFLPAIIAKKRDHANATPIALVNFFFGWSVLGWLVALIWACTSNTRV